MYNLQENYRRYKQAVGHSDIPLFKKKINKILQTQQFYSLMNDTKWLKLIHCIHELTFPPAYTVKLLNNAEQESVLIGIPNYIGDWSYFFDEGMPIFFCIEYIEVKAMLSTFRGKLIENEIQDETEALEKILIREHIPFQLNNNVFTIYAYKRAGTNVAK